MFSFCFRRCGLFLVLTLGILRFGDAQPFDTLRVMAYNLTNYGNVTTECPSSLNGPSVKNPDFKTILKHSQPDILGVCEMNTNPALGNGFLANVLNTDGVSHYRRSAHVVEPSGTLTCVLYYHGDKLVLHRQASIPMSTRLTHHYRLYVKTAGLALGDTIWLNVLACHLKAGNTTADANTRAGMTAAIRNYLQNFSPRENCLILGDFNVYSSSETAYQNLITAGTRPTYQFFDPINRSGNWSAAFSFADVHTQCPRTDNNNGCYSGGGLDDRFDFILMNRHLMQDSTGLRYIPGSYKALGNDGQHFNKNITASPVNTSAPLNVIQALFRASDHLPVLAHLRVKEPIVNSVKNSPMLPSFWLRLSPEGVVADGVSEEKSLDWTWFDFAGREVRKGRSEVQNGEARIPGPGLPGMYRLRVSDARGRFRAITAPGN